MNSRDKDKALKTLDGMAEIVKRERIVKGEYVSNEVEPEHSTAVCSGRRYCLLGSAWAAYGVRLIRGEYRDFEFPGIWDDDRAKFLRNRPALRAVYDALNKVADRRLTRVSEEVREDIAFTGYTSSAEGLFEEGDLGRTSLLRLIGSARREIEAA